LYGTVPVPNDWPEQQVKIVNEDISRHVRRVTYRTIDGVKQMLFDVPLLPTGETAAAVITFEIEKSALAPPADTSPFVVPTKPPLDVRKYLGPSPNIEATNPKIKNFAKELVEGKEGGWAQAEALYDGVRSKVKVENEKLKGAAAALRDGKGRYEDVTGLFVACCRSQKIPARMVYVPDDSYAEFYLQDADGQGHWFPCNVAATEREFGSISDQKPILQKGDNIRVPEQKEPQGFVAEFLTGKGNTGGRPEVEFIRRLEPAM
jgi:transglutaminase-like putative cysteine protease